MVSLVTPAAQAEHFASNTILFGVANTRVRDLHQVEFPALVVSSDNFYNLSSVMSLVTPTMYTEGVASRFANIATASNDCGGTSFFDERRDDPEFGLAEAPAEQEGTGGLCSLRQRSSEIRHPRIQRVWERGLVD